MIATLLSRAEGLLVIRELRATMPKSAPPGAPGLANVLLVAQTQGESHESFAARVLGRARRSLASIASARQIWFHVESRASRSMLESRRNLLKDLAAMLTYAPFGEIIIVAPGDTGAADRVALFELVESTLRAAPTLNVRLSFATAADDMDRRRTVKNQNLPHTPAPLPAT